MSAKIVMSSQIQTKKRKNHNIAQNRSRIGMRTLSFRSSTVLDRRKP
jgi:hypothetical protein